jgi:DNA-binding transcriptional ArsR family regulator
VINYVEVDNDFIWNIEEYDCKEQFITVLLRTLSMNPMGSARVGVNSLLQMLSLSEDKKNKASLKETLAEMEKKGMIIVFEDFTMLNQIQTEDMKYANDYFIVVSEVSDAKTVYAENAEEGQRKDNFTKIPFDVMMKFIAMNERNKSIAFAVYFNIVHWIWEGVSNGKVSNPTILTIAKATGLDKKTITKYVKVLRENELIYFETKREGTQEKNYYCKWEDREYFDDHVEVLKQYYVEREAERLAKKLKKENKKAS